MSSFQNMDFLPKIGKYNIDYIRESLNYSLKIEFVVLKYFGHVCVTSFYNPTTLCNITKL